MNRMVLADELRTLEAEHQNLQVLAAALDDHCLKPEDKNQCASCDKRMANECAAILNDRLAVLIMFLMTLARHEERLMKHACSEPEFQARFGAHVDDHANLCAELVGLAEVAATIPPAAIYAKAIRLTGHWLNEHFASHDRVLVEVLMDAPRSVLEAKIMSDSGWGSIISSAAEVGLYATEISGRIGSRSDSRPSV